MHETRTTARPSARITARLLLLVLAAALLSGCRLDLVVDVAVEADGAGELALTLSADAELLEQAERAGADPLGTLAGLRAELGSAGWRVDEEQAPGGGRSVRLGTRFDDPDDFNALAAELAAALAAPEVRLLDDLELTLGPASATLEGRASLVFTEAVAISGLSAAEVTRLLVEQEAVGYAVRVGMPGPVQTASSRDGDERRRVWELAPGEVADIAVSSGRAPDRPASPVRRGTLALLALALALVAVVLARAVRTRPRP